MAELRIVAGPSRGESFKIGLGITSIGREQTNSIQVNDFEVSRRHVELHVRANEFVLVDLASSNGTIVNGNTITTTTLKTGDQFMIGQSVFEFHRTSFVDVAAETETVGNGEDESHGISGVDSTFESIDQLLKAKSNLEVLYHAALAAGSFQGPESLLQRILDLVFCWVSAHRACILIREDEKENIFAKSINLDQPGGYSVEPFDMEYGVIKHVFRKKEGVVVNDIENDDRFPSVIDREFLQDRQIICAPIKSRYGIRGVIYADRSKIRLNEGDSIGPPFDEQQLKLLIAIGLHAAVSIENAEHYSMMLQSERVTAVGNAMSSLSHHIKNILQSINGGNHLIEDGLANQQFGLIESGWQIVQRNQENLSNLVMDMLSYGGSANAPRLQDSDINEIVRQAIQLVERRAEQSNVRIHFNPIPDMPTLLLEPELMVRALHNILLTSINSCKENSGGMIEVSLEKDFEAGRAAIEIRDNGVDVSTEELQSMFDPLAISENSNRIGLGMAVAKKVINEMDGSVTAKSKDRDGNSFTIEFPSIQELKATNESDSSSTSSETV